MNLINFKHVSSNKLNNVYGGFALTSWISLALLGAITWRVFNSDKGSLHLNGIGEAKWDDQSNKGANINKIIYYPY